MRNRVINLFTQDTSFRLRAIIILVIIVIVFLLWKTTQRQEIELVKLHQRLKQAKEMFAQIPMLEEKFKTLQEEVVILQSKPTKINFVLNGIFIKNNIHVALIGEKIYRENDSIGGFTISKITPKSVILKNKRTQGERIIYISK
jgi:type II secretory pathway component PulC